MTASAARQDALAATRSRPFRWLARGGFVARAITYGLIGAIALALALGAGQPATPNQQGALALIAGAPLGRLALVIIAAGLLGYASWKLVRAVLGHGPEGGGDPDVKDRIGDAAGGIAYLILCGVAVRVLVGSAGNSSSQTKHAAAGVLGWPGGQVLVGIAGVALIVISAYQAFDAARLHFADDIKSSEMSDGEYRLFTGLGLVGLIARSLVFGLIGYFLLRAAIDFDAAKAVGVNGALAAVHHEPYGPWLLGAVAAGLLTFAGFSLMEARYRVL